MLADIPQFLRDVLMLPPEGSTISSEIDALHLFVIGTTMVGATAVGAVALYLILHYRQVSPTQLTPHVKSGWFLETMFVGGTLGLFIVWWVIGYRQYVKMELPPSDALVVYVQAKQWMWKFTYANGRSTNDVLVVPSGKNIRLVMTSRDVIHSFFVPAFRVKQDALPGRYVTAWFRSDRAGTYPIYCAEYCGTSHSLMRGDVLVLDVAHYDAWLGGKAVGTNGPTLSARGQEAAMRYGCFACHTTDGQPHVGPTWSHLYGSTVTLSDDRVVVADEEYLTRSMMQPDVEIVAGFKPVMPQSYRSVLAPPDAAAIVEFIRSLKDEALSPAVHVPSLQIAVRPDAGETPSVWNPLDAGTTAKEIVP